MPRNLTSAFCKAMATLTLLPTAALAEMKLNFPKPVAPITQDIYDLHMLTAAIATVIMIIVTAMIVYALYTFRKSRDYQPDLEFHKGWFGRWAWALVPIIVLGIDFSIAGPAQKTLNLIESHPDADLTIKVVGSQWKWTYEYLDGDDDTSNDISIVSNLNRDPKPDNPLYLRDVDHALILPTDRTIRFLHTATDVLHAWWVPAISYKKDSIPGYINETWTKIEEAGTYRGQCAENCGTGHSYMPIVVKAIDGAEFDQWQGEQVGLQVAATAEASSDKTWALEELMTKGQAVYASNCLACHQAEGQGLPPAFPALAGSDITTKDLAAHLKMVIHGSETNPIMAAWGKTLNDLDLAAVITYERNAFGNSTGDVIQPADVKATR